jgi:phosphatidylserine/phosphatidylglycerophosphate/cardiolipin synthase-like enzyme
MNQAEIDRILSQTLADGRLSGGEKRALVALFEPILGDEQKLGFARHRMFEVARDAVIDPTARAVIDWLEEVSKVLQRPAGPATATPAAVSEAHFSPGNECVAQILHLFTKARSTADVCVFTITDDRIARAVLAAHSRGVKVRIISDNDKSLDLGSDIARLSDAGIPVRLDRSPYHMHHKFALFDGTWLLNGSFNWTRGASEQNEENLVVTTDPHLVRRFSAEFEKLWTQFA